MQLIELARRLVEIPSITGDEAAIGNFLASYLESRGLGVALQPVSPGRTNVIAWCGTAAPPFPEIVFSTHMDTVPPYIPFAEDSTYISGRGSCDAKGIMAAQICAVEQLREEGFENIGLLFTVDEEAAGLGARTANTHPWADRCRFLINGEPTDNRLAIGSKGSLRLRLETAGRPAHSAYPEQGDSAIEKLLQLLRDIQEARWPTDPFFGETTCNIGRIGGGTASNIVPAQAWAELHIRLVTPSAEALSLIQSLIAGRASVECLSIAEPIRLTEVSGFEPIVVRFTTDIPHLNRWGAPLLMGPGSILAAHTAGERVAKTELAQAVTQYIDLAKALNRQLREERA